MRANVQVPDVRIDLRAEEISLTIQHTMTPQSHTMPHSFKPSIDPSVNGSLAAPLCVVEGSLMNVMRNAHRKFPHSIHPPLWLMRNHSWPQNLICFSQINEEHLSVSIMLCCRRLSRAEMWHTSDPQLMCQHFSLKHFFHLRTF